MKYTTFAYETHKETFCYVQQIWRKLSLRQRNETYSNTSHPRCVVSLSCTKHTRHAHTNIMKSVTRKRCNLRYTYRRNCCSTTEIKLTPHNKTDVPSQTATTNPHTTTAPRTTRVQYALQQPSCDWFRPQLRRASDLRLCWHLLSSAGNTCLSIQSLVLVMTFRCHFFVAHSAYPSFWVSTVICTADYYLWICTACRGLGRPPTPLIALTPSRSTVLCSTNLWSRLAVKPCQGWKPNQQRQTNIHLLEHQFRKVTGRFHAHTNWLCWVGTVRRGRTSQLVVSEESRKALVD